MNDHTDSEDARRLHNYEMGEDDPIDRDWLKWVSELEKALSLKTLDGDQSTDGYSLDWAADFYEKGMAVPEAAAAFRTTMEEANKA